MTRARRATRGRSALLALAFVTAPTLAWAHDPGLSALELRIEALAMTATLGLATVDAERLVPVDADGDWTVSPAELAAARPLLEALARQAVEVRCDGRPVSPSNVGAEVDPTGGVRLRLRFPKCPSGGVAVRSAILERMPRGHREYAALRDARGRLLSDVMLGPGADELTFHAIASEPQAGAAGTFRRFVLLGLRHIFTGYDHLAFLLGLLIAGGSLRSAAKIVTSFTVAHSITLALATFDLVHLPARVTEPLIAASIVYVGIENLLRRVPSRRWMLTFGFGLVHGFGFATVLRELGIGAGGASALVPLVSFNLGVELGQLSIASLALPVIWAAGRRPRLAARLLPAGSLAVVLLGGFWLVQRTLAA